MVAVPKKIPKNAQPFDSLGETWWLSEVDAGRRILFASMVRASARQQLIQDKAFLSPESYAEESDRLQDRIDSGAYEWGPPVELGGIGAGNAIAASLNGGKGKVLLIQMLLAEQHGELDLNRVADIINGNPDAVSAALRAAQGIPPLEESPAEDKTPGTTEKPASANETPGVSDS